MAKNADDVATITSDGLFGTFPGLEVQFPRLREAEQAHWNNIIDMPLVRFVRHRTNVWYMLFPEPAVVASAWSSAPDGGAQAGNYLTSVILEHSMENIETHLDHNDVSFALAGTISHGTDDVMSFHVGGYVDVHRMEPTTEQVVEAAWHHSKTPGLASISSALPKDSMEQSLTPENDCLSKLPTASVARLLEVALVALENDTSLVDLLNMNRPSGIDPSSTQKFAEYMLFFLAGRCGEVVQTWPSNQKWCLD